MASKYLTMNKFEAFEKLKEFSKKLTSVSYEEIYDVLQNGVKCIPFPIAKLRKSAYIDRVRPNEDKNLFKHIDELGYIKNKNVIDKLTTFGRANKPHQVMFYGAIETSLIDKQRVTAIIETSPLFIVSDMNCIKEELCTVSRWEVQEELSVVEVVFSEHALKNNPNIIKSHETQKSTLIEWEMEQKEENFYLDFLKFISEEFAKKVANPEEYKISVAYTHLALIHSGALGIAYPSVQTDYLGVNVVLLPETIDKYVKPISCHTQIVYKKGIDFLITNGEYYCDEIDVTKEIKWEKFDESILTSKEDVKVFFDDKNS